MMPRGAYRIFDAARVAAAYDEMAAHLNEKLPDREILLLPVRMILMLEDTMKA